MKKILLLFSFILLANCIHAQTKYEYCSVSIVKVPFKKGVYAAYEDKNNSTWISVKDSTGENRLFKSETEILNYFGELGFLLLFKELKSTIAAGEQDVYIFRK